MWQFGPVCVMKFWKLVSGTLTRNIIYVSDITQQLIFHTIFNVTEESLTIPQVPWDLVALVDLTDLLVREKRNENVDQFGLYKIFDIKPVIF